MKTNFILSDDIESKGKKCLCYNSCHGYFNFGNNTINDETCIYHSITKKEIIELNLHNDKRLIIDDFDPNIDEYEEYVIYISNNVFHEKYNPFTNNICLCCEDSIIKLNVHNCDDCGCILCGNCFIQGRYYDTKLCYNCRKFGFHKNEWFYSNSKKSYYKWISESEKEYFDEGLEDWLESTYYY